MLVVGAVVACSTHEAMKTPDAADVVTPDACPVPKLSNGCVPNAFDLLSPDGEWHMTGTSSMTVVANIGEPPMTTTSSVDKQVFIARSGCTGGFGDTAMPALNALASPNGIGADCDHASGCMRGAAHWWVCVDPDGKLIYESHRYMTTTMPGGYQWNYDDYGVLTR